jgi:hypothetical protein
MFEQCLNFQSLKVGGAPSSSSDPPPGSGFRQFFAMIMVDPQPVASDRAASYMNVQKPTCSTDGGNVTRFWNRDYTGGSCVWVEYILDDDPALPSQKCFSDDELPHFLHIFCPLPPQEVRVHVSICSFLSLNHRDSACSNPRRSQVIPQGPTLPRNRNFCHLFSFDVRSGPVSSLTFND